LHTQAFVFNVKNANKKHVSLVHDKLQRRTEFGVKHFAGDVIYEASEFVERNADKLPDFLIDVTSTSTNDLVAQELRSLTDESNKVAAGVRKKSNHRSVIDKFSRQLKELLNSIDNSQTRYVRCIKPCEGAGRVKTMDHQTVVSQLKCAGLVTAIELSRETFPNKLPFHSVEHRFACLLPREKQTYIKELEPHDRAQLILTILFAPCIERFRGSDFAMPFSCGYTKVYFRAGALEALEIDRQTLFSREATRIQKWVRMTVYQSKFHRMTRGFSRLQAVRRMQPVAVGFRLQKAAATKIQAALRSIIRRAQFILTKYCVSDIELWWLSVRTRIRYCRMLTAATSIAAWMRMHQARKRFQRAVLVVSILQAQMRGGSQMRRFLEQRGSADVINAWWKVKTQRLSYLRLKSWAVALETVWRSRTLRIRFRRLKIAITLLQARSRSRTLSARYRQFKQAAQCVRHWCRGVTDRRHFQRHRSAATLLTCWLRSRVYRATFLRSREAANKLSSVVRAKKQRSQFMRLKAAAVVVSRKRHKFIAARQTCAAVQLQKIARIHLSMKRFRESLQKHRLNVKLKREVNAVLKLQCHIRSFLKSKKLQHAVCLLDPKQDGGITTTQTVISRQKPPHALPGDTVLVSREVIEELDRLRKQTLDLNTDLMNVTAEAELHKQEVEAEFEERLIAYEEEVLLLKRTIVGHEEEKERLNAEVTANVQNVQNLKVAIRTLQSNHKDYLGKVTRAIEKATMEHRNAIDAVKQDRDDKLSAMNAEMNKLKKKRRKDTPQQRLTHIHGLARKLEKLIAPDSLASVAERAIHQHAGRSTTELFETVVSSKARKVIYQLEDLAVAFNSTNTGSHTGDRDCIQALQQQLVVAYEEIESLQSATAAANVPKRHLRKIFDRLP
jgi:myosin heavy subunit